MAPDDATEKRYGKSTDATDEQRGPAVHPKLFGLSSHVCGDYAALPTNRR